MPAFDPIGFFLPLAVAALYLYRALQHWRSRNTVYMALLGFLTYLVPIKHLNGVGLVPMYVLLAGAVIYPRQNPPRWWPERMPLAAMLPPSFASIAVPDFVLTWQTGGALWTVGGARWEDGLLRFWLYLIPVFTTFRFLFDFAVAHDSRQTFDIGRWFRDQLSPWRGRSPASASG